MPSAPEGPQGTPWPGVASVSDGLMEDILFPSRVPSGLTFWANGCSILCLLTWQAASLVHSNTGSNWTLTFLGIWLPGMESSRCHKLVGYFNSDFDEFLTSGRLKSSWELRSKWVTTVHNLYFWNLGFSGGSVDKESSYNAGDLSSITRSASSPGGGLGNPLQYSSSENPIDRGAWQATAHGVQRVKTKLK